MYEKTRRGHEGSCVLLISPCGAVLSFDAANGVGFVRHCHRREVNVMRTDFTRLAALLPRAVICWAVACDSVDHVVVADLAMFTQFGHDSP